MAQMRSTVRVSNTASMSTVYAIIELIYEIISSENFTTHIGVLNENIIVVGKVRMS